MNISGHTEPFAVLGHPIGHTLSPVMHNASFKALGLDAIYLAFDVAPERLMEVLPAMRLMGFRGVNLTVPLKEVAFNGLSRLDASAKRLGAVNTVEFLPGGDMQGHNTDGAGFVTATREAFGCDLAGLSVFILGCGGAGRAVALTCAAEGAARLAFTDLDASRPQRLHEEVTRELGGKGEAVIVGSDPSTWAGACREADLIVQATPMGMKESDASLVDADGFRHGQFAFDLVYMYPETSFMRAAREGGAASANGLGMLLHQGARAFSIWTGNQPAADVMREALEAEVYG